MRHANISIFVPHLGCTNNCSFCNQKHITGQTRIPSAQDVINAVETAKKSNSFDGNSTEIAFFGGSFTAIEREYMISLLSAAKQYVTDGTVRGIRISTRPDCISNEILSLLSNYGVTAIELGAQSMDDSVLMANNRGHTEQDVVNASILIKEFGFELGLQMMTGLYKSDDNLDFITARKIASLQPDNVRIYPTIVLRNTSLALLFINGEYNPQSLDSAVKLCAKIKSFFNENGINVIRLGLHSIDSDAYVSGPWHPAFSELCDSEIYRTVLDEKITSSGTFEIFVCQSEVSKALGHKRENVNYFLNKGVNISVKTDNTLDKYNVRIEEVK